MDSKSDFRNLLDYDAISCALLLWLSVTYRKLTTKLLDHSSLWRDHGLRKFRQKCRKKNCKTKGKDQNQDKTNDNIQMDPK
jgi:hypothetical protein